MLLVLAACKLVLGPEITVNQRLASCREQVQAEMDEAVLDYMANTAADDSCDDAAEVRPQ